MGNYYVELRDGDCDAGALWNHPERHFRPEHEEKPRGDAGAAEQDPIGARVLFGGGIYGKIVKIKGDVIDVEMAKGLVVQISRFGIQDVVSEQK